ncbi:MAG: DUF1573 domain-containing protein [Prevotella sp.]|jgi:hypothetical protein|nr:DUF1573 domain-containing protein [Prevotella sp.]
MKKIGLFLFLAVFGFQCMSAQSGLEKKPAAKFEKTTHTFGKVAEEIGQAVCSFEFVNTGTAPLIVNKVGTSCGCTASSYTKEPVLPGQKGEIKLSYNTANRIGAFEKSATVFTNVPDTVFRLYIKGEVLPKKIQ